MNADARAAGRYFDLYEAPLLRRNGVPEADVRHLRAEYVRSAVTSPGTMRSIKQMPAVWCHDPDALAAKTVGEVVELPDEEAP